MPQIKDSFILNSNVPNFTRDSFDTWEDMILVDPDNIDKGHISYCKETKKHYIFHNEDDVLWKDLSYQDVLTVTKDEMLDLKDDVPVGKLIYCTTDGLMYYKYRNATEDNTDIYKKLVNIEDATYVTEEEFPNMVDERIRDFDFGTSGLVTYETIEDMKKVVPGDDSVIEYGQLAFCEETKLHYYFDNERNDNYGYFKLLSGSKTLIPKIIEPYSYISLLGEDEDKIIKEVGEIAPIAGEFGIDAYLGEIDYSEFPYPMENQTYTSKVIMADDLGEYPGESSNVYCEENPMGTADNPSYIKLGNQKYYYKTYFAPNITPQDSNGNVLDELAWDRNKEVKSSNFVVINGTRPWYASTVVDVVKQPLFEWKDVVVVEAELLPTYMINQEFRIPLEIKELYIADPVDNNWIKDDLSEWSVELYEDYYIYKYKVNELGHRGSIKIKVIF